MYLSIKHRGAFIFFLIAALLFIAAAIWFNFNSSLESPVQVNKSLNYEEIQKIKATDDITKRQGLYLKLIKRVGPVSAQEALFHSGLPFTGGTHLLNHTVGEFLYNKYGPSGIIYCKDYFSSSCYHGIVINALADGKFEKLNVMIDVCRKQGNAVLNQCVHGLGHGFLPYVGYKNLLEALKLCDTAGKNIQEFSYYNCYSGVFMENIWGVHEGQPSPERWVDGSDYNYPCDDPRIEYKYLAACWYNQNSLLLNYLQGDQTKTGKVCESLPDESFKKECFEGLFNSIEGASRGNVGKQFKQCNLMPEVWATNCLLNQIVFETARGGTDSSFEICARITKLDKERCYKTIQNSVNYFMSEREMTSVCRKIPKEFKKDKCLKYL